MILFLTPLIRFLKPGACYPVIWLAAWSVCTGTQIERDIQEFGGGDVDLENDFQSHGSKCVN